MSGTVSKLNLQTQSEHKHNMENTTTGQKKKEKKCIKLLPNQALEKPVHFSLSQLIHQPPYHDPSLGEKK